MDHIDKAGGRFVTVLPRTRREDGQLRDWMIIATPDYTEAVRRPGKRDGEPDQVYRVAPAPFCSSEGHRIVWVHSSTKAQRAETARHQRIQRTLAALTELGERLAGPRARITTRVAAQDAAQEILDHGGAEDCVTFAIAESTEERFRQEKRGHPGKDTRYRKINKTRFQLTAHVDADAVRHDAASDGCFPLISNDHDLTDTQVLIAYRSSPNLEKRHHQLKSVHDAAPATLTSPARIEALFACQLIALLACCLIERELRNSMTRQQITDLPLYPEDRTCSAPTAARVVDHLAPLQRHHLIRDGNVVQTFQPQLTPLQAQLLDLLGLPASAYTPAPDPSRPAPDGGRIRPREVRKRRYGDRNGWIAGHGTGEIRLGTGVMWPRVAVPRCPVATKPISSDPAKRWSAERKSAGAIRSVDGRDNITRSERRATWWDEQPTSTSTQVLTANRHGSSTGTPPAERRVIDGQLLRDLIVLAYPDRHPAERSALATRTTANLLELRSQS